MDEPKLTCITDFIINYLNNVLNINILLVTIGLILLFWAFKASKKEIKNQWWFGLISLPILLGIFSIIQNIIIYRELIDEITKTSLGGKIDLTKPLTKLDIVFYMDILIISLLLISFFGIKNERNS
ncbi:MAG: hypothetical protein HYX60_01870 [Legionella longbeachae]|nr:hypothetical protein [Legionella longbeachae]